MKKILTAVDGKRSTREILLLLKDLFWLSCASGNVEPGAGIPVLFTKGGDSGEPVTVGNRREAYAV